MVFHDVAVFMKACDQTRGEYNEAQNEIEAADAIADLIWVLTGLAFSMGIDLGRVWHEVARSNMSKIDPETGKVIKRADGKVMKPKAFSPPNLTFVRGFK